MTYDQTIITQKGLVVHIRNGVASDGSAVLENFHLTHAETDYLRTYPDENHFDAEQESRYLEKKVTSPNEIELIAFVDGKVAGTAGIDAIGAQYKVAHRAEFCIQDAAPFDRFAAAVVHRVYGGSLSLASDAAADAFSFFWLLYAAYGTGRSVPRR